MVDLFDTDNIEEFRRMDEKSDWNYVDDKLEPYFSGYNVEVRELADNIAMFVHASYSAG